MAEQRMFTYSIARIHALYVAKVERKGRTRAEVDEVVCWLTGYDAAGLRRAIEGEVDLQTFFAQAPAINPGASRITGVICGHRVEDIEDPLVQQIRWLDKLVDEVARGRPMAKVLRGSEGPRASV